MRFHRRRTGLHCCRLCPGRDIRGISLWWHLHLRHHLDNGENRYSVGLSLHRRRRHKRGI
jgi:hypothetical protein